jgi:hypothetical protein
MPTPPQAVRVKLSSKITRTTAVDRDFFNMGEREELGKKAKLPFLTH